MLIAGRFIEGIVIESDEYDRICSDKISLLNFEIVLTSPYNKCQRSVFNV